jgi:hypothetical protein
VKNILKKPVVTFATGSFQPITNEVTCFALDINLLHARSMYTTKDIKIVTKYR